MLNNTKYENKLLYLNVDAFEIKILHIHSRIDAIRNRKEKYYFTIVKVYSRKIK